MIQQWRDKWIQITELYVILQTCSRHFDFLKSISKSCRWSSFLIWFSHHLWSTFWAIFAWDTCPFLAHFPCQTHGISRIYPLPDHHLCCLLQAMVHAHLGPSSSRPSGCSERCRFLFLCVKTLCRCPLLEYSNSLNLVCSPIHTL